ncbi:hypothetical protein BCR36DRAFT_580243 [Piromyces finnis]|uniref:Extracellular membrane protein CFEM domain-containing protein n=1 Tax=Piromyces finnis TaxID=1754191 RepID=A0A1Y1VKN4_9FUNG|nr:hypothetical protein BCR36DRAFT_580243 [Piromyces finnis]|eukprot:ORX58642.1 hypothetical protein BCR36DRAFT_580243 [Piromyces finnis]
MRFSIPVFTLLAASSVYSDVIGKNLFNSEACRAEVRNYSECLATPDASNFEKNCKLITSSICQDFYANARSLVSKCVDSPEIFTFISPSNMAILKKTQEELCKKLSDGITDKKTTKVTVTKTKTISKTVNEPKSITAITAEPSTTTTTIHSTQKVTSKPRTTSSATIKTSATNTSITSTGTTNAGATNTGAVNTDALNNGAVNNGVYNGPANTGAVNGNGSTLGNVVSGNSNISTTNDASVNPSSGASTIKISTGLFITLGLLLLSF